MAVTYTPAKADALSKAFPGQPFDDPGSAAYAAAVRSRIDSKFFLKPVQDELMALIADALATPGYTQQLTCLTGLAVGEPVRISGNTTVAKALATTSANAKVIGFVAHKGDLFEASDGAALTCYITHYRYASGLSGGTAGNPVYLSDAGGYSASAGTYSKIVGIWLSTTTALLVATPLSAQNTVDLAADYAWTGAHSWAGKVSLTGVVSVSDPGASLDDYDPSISAKNILRITPTSGGTTITGLVGGTAGKLLILHNIGSTDPITLSHNTTSTAANRFWCPSLKPYILNAGCSLLLAYDGVESLWRVIDRSTPVDNSTLELHTDGKIRVKDAFRPYFNLLDGSCYSLWQRQTPGSETSRADDTYGPDRWFVLTQTAAITVSRQAGDSAQYSARLTQSQAGAQRMGLASIVEASRSIPMQGKTVRFQGRIRCSSSQAIRYAIVGWDGTADSVTSDIVSDWTSSNYTESNFFIAGAVAVGVGSTTPSADTWTDINISGAVPSDCTNLIAFVWTEGTAAQNVTLAMEAVLLCEGDAARNWQPEPVAVNLARCQHRCFVIENGNAADYIANGLVASSSTAQVLITFPFPMAGQPALTATASEWSGYDGASAVLNNLTIFTTNSTTVRTDRVLLDCRQAGTTWTTGRAFQLLSNTSAGRRLIFDKEL